MIFRLVKSNHAIVLFLFPLIAVLFWLPDIVNNRIFIAEPDDTMMPLFKLVLQITKNNFLVNSIVTLTLTIVQALLIIKLNKDFMLIEQRNYLPFILFLILSSVLPQVHYLHPVTFANLFILGAVFSLFKTYGEETDVSNFFDASLLISIGSLFYFNSIFFIAVIWSAVIIIHTMRLREWLLTIIGLVTPYLFIFSFYYIYSSPLTIIEIIHKNIDYQRDFSIYNKQTLIFFAYIAFLIIISSLRIISQFNKKKIGTRKFYKVLFWLFLITIVIFVAAPTCSLEIIQIFAIPVSFILSNYLVSLKKEIYGNLILLVLIGLAILIQVY